MQDSTTIRNLLQDLRGGGFNTSLLVDGFEIVGQKVVSFESGVVFSVDAGGVARATVIGQIDSVNF